nr:MAG TPA: hypothetical protein [Caudoviricetes sp.]
MYSRSFDPLSRGGECSLLTKKTEQCMIRQEKHMDSLLTGGFL